MNSGVHSKWPFGSFLASCAAALGTVMVLLFGVGVYFAFRSPPPNPLSSDERKAKVEILAWVPLGTSLKDAEVNLRHHNFHCSVTREKDGTSTLVASIDGSGWITYPVWFAAFKIDRDKVTDLSVHVRNFGP